MSRSRPVPVLAGPTAVGKTSLAIETAARLGADIISADSRQVYLRLEIGTAKPTPEERARARHLMIDFVEPGQTYSAAAFARDARREMDRLDSEGRPYLVAGGSGLYIRALTEGLSPMPPADPEVGRRLRREAESEGTGILHQRLVRLDPETAARLKPADRSRIIRALEVLESTGRSIARWQAAPRQGDGRDYRVIVLSRSRQELYRRIDQRADEMLRHGLEMEVRGLLESGLRGFLDSVKAVGYREVLSHLDGKIDRAAMSDLIKRNTRRFAKRQVTWFRGASPAAWLVLDGEHDPAGRVLELAGRAGP